jgi:hypothetical protein
MTPAAGASVPMTKAEPVVALGLEAEPEPPVPEQPMVRIAAKGRNRAARGSFVVCEERCIRVTFLVAESSGAVWGAIAGPCKERRRSLSRALMVSDEDISLLQIAGSGR